MSAIDFEKIRLDEIIKSAASGYIPNLNEIESLLRQRRDIAIMIGNAELGSEYHKNLENNFKMIQELIKRNLNL